MKHWLLPCLSALTLLALACNQPVAVSGKTDPPSVAAIDSQPATPTTAADGEPVKQALHLILNLAKIGDCANMAPLLAFQEGEGSDIWHRGLRYDVIEEQLAAEKECAKLQVLVTGLQGYTFQEFSSEQEDEGEWLIWKVALQYQDGETDEKIFAFLRVPKGYLLGDID